MFYFLLIQKPFMSCFRSGCMQRRKTVTTPLVLIATSVTRCSCKKLFTSERKASACLTCMTNSYFNDGTLNQTQQPVKKVTTAIWRTRRGTPLCTSTDVKKKKLIKDSFFLSFFHFASGTDQFLLVNIYLCAAEPHNGDKSLSSTKIWCHVDVMLGW